MDELLTMTSLRISRNGSWIYGGSKKWLLFLLSNRFFCIYDITQPGKEVLKIKDSQFGVLSSIHDNESIVGLTSFNSTAFLYDPSSNEWIWKQQIGSRGLHEMILTSSPFMILNERFNNSLHIYDLRNLSSEVTSVERYSQSQQVSLVFEISIRNLKFLFLLIINSFVQEMEKGMWLFLVLKEIWYLSRSFMVVCRI